MKYRLKIADEIEFPVELTYRNGANLETHKFHLTAKRIDAHEDRELTAPDGAKGDVLIADFLREKIVGWRDQDFIVGEDDLPAPYSIEALNLVFSQIPGAENVLFVTYLRELRAVSGAEGRRKN